MQLSDLVPSASLLGPREPWAAVQAGHTERLDGAQEESVNCVFSSLIARKAGHFYFFLSSAGKGTIDFCSSILQEPGHASPLPEYSSAWQRISHYLVSRRENAAHRVIISAILSASISYS